tara:strand:+ start:431 stop:769 length:339 start_codon:yes stop_codon:yes gene_type:complete
MIQWIWTLLKKIWSWGLDDRIFRRKLAGGVPRDESPDEVPGGVVAEWAQESVSELDDGSNAQRLEKEEGYQGSGTSKLSEQSGGVPQSNQGSGDLDYTMKEHFFSPLNPTNK